MPQQEQDQPMDLTEAKQVLKENAGQVPTTSEEMKKLKEAVHLVAASAFKPPQPRND